MHLIEKKSCFLQQLRKIATMVKNEIKIAISTFFGQLGREGMEKTSQFFFFLGIPPFFPPLEETLNQSHILKIDF